MATPTIIPPLSHFLQVLFRVRARRLLPWGMLQLVQVLLSCYKRTRGLSAAVSCARSAPPRISEHRVHHPPCVAPLTRNARSGALPREPQHYMRLTTFGNVSYTYSLVLGHLRIVGHSHTMQNNYSALQPTVTILPYRLHWT